MVAVADFVGSTAAMSGRAPLIIGGGLAGLMTALRLAPMPAVVLAKAPLGAEASSGWAQGGIAAAIGPDDDPELHLADTLAAGDGLCDVAVARRITAAAPAAIETLLRYVCASIALQRVRFPSVWKPPMRGAASCTPPATVPGGRSCVR
jgi:glycine/D-amino acid oxidase-like deaminating enzyme